MVICDITFLLAWWFFGLRSRHPRSLPVFWAGTGLQVRERVIFVQHGSIPCTLAPWQGVFAEKAVYFRFTAALSCQAMPPSLINRYLARELLVPSLACLLVFTLVLLAGRLVQLADLVIGKGVALVDILQLLATLLPPMLVIIVPLAFLMGIMLGFGRLSADSETVALKAGGVGLFAMARPVLLLAAGCALLTLLLSCWAAPWGKRAFRTTLFEITSKQASIGLQAQIFLKQFSNLVLYANDLDPRSGMMSGVFIVEQQPEGPLLILAESGQVHSDPQQQTVTLQLHNGVIHRQQSGGQGDAYQVIGFASYGVTPDLSSSLAAETGVRKVSRKEMSLRELWHTAEADSAAAPAARGELHRRLSAPLAPLLFALLALPFSTFSQRSGRSGGFIVGLAIYLAYYLLVSLGETLTAEGNLPPLLTFWVPHLLLFAVAVYLLRQSALERPVAVLGWLDRCALHIKRFRERHAHH
jgi:lipopolysaccharide export system permease protein